MSSSTSLTADPSFTVETIQFGSLVTAEITVSLTASTPAAITLTSSASSTTTSTSTSTSTSSSTPTPTSISTPTSEITSFTIMSSTTATAASAATTSAAPSSSHSGISKGASIGIGVGLAVVVLFLLGGLLWFFSMHKRYQEDEPELEIGQNTTDYRRKDKAVVSPPPGTNRGDEIVPVQHLKKESKSSSEMPAPGTMEYERPNAPTPRTSMSPDRDPVRKRADGFF